MRRLWLKECLLNVQLVVVAALELCDLWVGEASAGRKPDVDGDDLAGLASKLFRWARNNPDLKVIPAVERELVINALKETDGNQVQSAKLLGITRATLRKRIEKFDIKQGLTVE